jgi:hypothetical protein
MRAASSSSSGIVSMYWRSRNTPVGVAAAGMMTPQSEPKMPKVQTTKNSDTRMIEVGISSVATIRIVKVSRPRNWYFDSAKAAIALMISVMTSPSR